MSNVSSNNNTATYRGITINAETALKEYIYDKEYTYIKINGVKYYYEESKDQWFHVINGKKYYEGSDTKFSLNKNDMAVKYYQEAAEFTGKMANEYGLLDLTPADAVALDETPINNLTDENGDSVYDFIDNNSKIFDFGNIKGIESPTSNFNQHRRAVIRYTIEKNLSIALNNYNEFGKNHDFRMPKLKETDWDKLLNNISLISFLQGLNIGNRIYNGYSIINNNKNKEVVTEDSIYIADKDSSGEYTRVTDKSLTDVSNKIGVFNYDFERQTMEPDDDAENVLTKYYYPKRQLGSYTGYVAQTNTEEVNDIYTYLDARQDLAKIYYTALGRERYSMYKSFRNPTNHKAKIIENTQSAVGGTATADKTYIDKDGNLHNNTIPDGYEATDVQDANGYWKLQEIKRNINIEIRTTMQNIRNYSNIPINGKSIDYSRIATYVPTGYDIVSITVGKTTIQPGETYNDLVDNEKIVVYVKENQNLVLPLNVYDTTGKTITSQIIRNKKKGDSITYGEIAGYVSNIYEIVDINIADKRHLNKGGRYDNLTNGDNIKVTVKKIITHPTLRVHDNREGVILKKIINVEGKSIKYNDIKQYVPEGCEIRVIRIQGKLLSEGGTYSNLQNGDMIDVYTSRIYYVIEANYIRSHKNQKSTIKLKMHPNQKYSWRYFAHKKGISSSSIYKIRIKKNNQDGYILLNRYDEETIKSNIIAQIYYDN